MRVWCGVPKHEQADPREVKEAFNLFANGISQKNKI